MVDYSYIHYFITLVFFIVLIIATLELTNSLFNFSINENDADAVDAKNTLTVAVTIGWVTIFLIFIGLSIVFYLGYQGKFSNSTLQKGLSYLSGSDKFYESIRIVTFSLLVFSSFLMGILCFATDEFINSTLDPTLYSSQYNTCYEFGKLLILHIFILFLIQTIVFVYSLAETPNY